MTPKHAYLDSTELIQVLKQNKEIPRRKFRLRATICLLFLLLMIPGMVQAQANQRPVADAGGDVSMFLGDAVYLVGSATDAENDPITFWVWGIISKPAGSTESFEPSNLSQVPLFFANQLGLYVVELTACDAAGCGFGDVITVSIVDNLPPTAVASADVVSGPAPLTVNFDGSASSDPEGGPLVHLWTFTDTYTNSFLISPSHTYVTPGTYTESLTVFDDWGLLGEDTILITVLPQANRPPTAAPSASAQSGTAPLTVDFIANASDLDDDALGYAWDFGDGASSSMADPTYTYTMAGTYTVTLTVNDGLDPITETLTIVVDSTLDLSVKEAKIKWKKADHTRAKVEIKGNLTPTTPGANDQIALLVDGTEIFSVPFSAFMRAGDDDEDDDEDEDGDDDDHNQGMYKLKAKHLRVEFDVVKGRFEVMRKNADLSTLDNRNGVTVEIHIGNNIAVENLTMEDKKEKLRYERHDHHDGHD